MKLTINSIEMPFKVSQNSEIWQTSYKKQRPDITDNYSSENYTVPKFYSFSDPIKIPLFNIFDTIEEMEAAIHKLFYYATITSGNKLFSAVLEVGVYTGSAISFTGVVTDKIKVKYKRNANKISVDIDLIINEVPVA